MGKIEEDWNGLKLRFLKTVQPNSFSKFSSAVCSFKNNAQGTYLFVSNLRFCHLHVISLPTFCSVQSRASNWQNKTKWTGLPWHSRCNGIREMITKKIQKLWRKRFYKIRPKIPWSSPKLWILFLSLYNLHWSLLACDWCWWSEWARYPFSKTH